jgi:hypothetical protein
LHKNLFSWDSLKIIGTTFPFYVGVRMFDEKLQNCFYDCKNHKNINQMSGWCNDFARFAIGVPIAFLGSFAFFGKDEEIRQTARIFLIGMPFVIFGKDILKKFKFDACLRPWNEHFSKEKRSSGGFPSGHMSEISYMAFLFGLRYGPKFAVPLGLLGVVVGVDFLTCNRHYASQLIAGIGFGALYAVAAHKLVNTRLGQSLQINLAYDGKRGPLFNVSYEF